MAPSTFGERRALNQLRGESKNENKQRRMLDTTCFKLCFVSRCAHDVTAQQNISTSCSWLLRTIMYVLFRIFVSPNGGKRVHRYIYYVCIAASSMPHALHY